MEAAAPNPYGSTALADLLFRLRRDIVGDVREDMAQMESRQKAQWERHALEHADRDRECDDDMRPLRERLQAEHDADVAREARIGPIKAAATWTLSNWPKVVVIVGAVLAILTGLHELIKALPF
jgi:hypothetical protein